MQDSMGTPFKGVKFDQVSFMLYRVELEKLANQLKAATNHSIEVNAFAIKTYAIRSLRYAENAKNFWGKNPRTSVDLGEVGRVSFPENFTGMLDPNELVKDINAARVAGVKNINIYSLDGMLNEKGLAAWLAPIHNCIAATPDIKFSLPHRVSAKDVTKTIQHEEWNAEFHAGAIDQSLSLTYLGQVF
jgi:hypothetical protein